MFKYIFKRITLLVLALCIILTISFFLMDLMPGYPASLSDIDESSQGVKNGNSSYAALWKAYLNTSIFSRFIDYIHGIFVGNHNVTIHLEDGTVRHLELGRFGYIFDKSYIQNPTDLPSLFFKPLKYTIMVTGPSFVFSSIIGILLGFVSAYKRGKWQDTAINVFVMLFIAIPSFVLAILFMILGRNVGLPIAFDDSLGLSYQIKSLILPIFILTLGGIATLTYYTRNEVVEILKSDFITIARAKGLSEMQILVKHVFRNASIPLVSIILPSFIGLLGGSFVIEVFFAIPGSSRVLINAVPNKDIYIVQFNIMFFATLSLSIALLVDITYAFIDPRIKIASSQKMTLTKRVKLMMLRRNTLKKSNAELKIGKDH